MHKEILLLLISVSTPQAVISNEYQKAYAALDLNEIHAATGIKFEELSKIIAYFHAKEQRGEGAWIDSYDILPDLIQKFGLSIGCEIGVAHGFHSHHLLKNTAIKKLYSIDPYHYFDPRETMTMNLPQKKFDVLYHLVKARLAEFGNRSVLMRLTSQEASTLFENNQLDFVYIDANHTYKSVKEDLESWFDKVKIGGIIAGDDYSSSFPGVKLAVDEFFAKRNLTVVFHPVVPRFFWVIKK